MEEKGARSVVKVFSILSILSGIVVLFTILYGMSGGGSGVDTVLSRRAIITIFLYCLFGIFWIIGGIFLWKQKNWARIFIFILILLSFILIISWFVSTIRAILMITEVPAMGPNPLSLQMAIIFGISVFFIPVVFFILYIIFFMFNKSVKQLFKR